MTTTSSTGAAPPRHDPPAATQPGYWTTWQLWHRVAREQPDALAHLALRARSPLALDALALAATGGRLDAVALAELSLEGSVPTLCASVERFRPSAALALAWAGMARTELDLTAATTVYRRLWTSGMVEHLPPVHHHAAAQVFFLTGCRTELPELLGDLTKVPRPVRHYLEVDLANPYLPGAAGSTHEQWEARLSAMFTDAGLAPLRVRPPAWAEGTAPRHLFDQLGSDPVPPAGGVAEGPLVSVVMPCYRPDEGLLNSIASISTQTWPNLEILVVDDASGAEFDDIFARAVGSDPRARLVRMERNGGSYLARNAALEQVRGELVTFQDADDWSHPQRIEHQARLLVQQPEAPASRSLAVRAKDDLTHQWFGYRAVRDNASSLMVRRGTFDRIGPFAAIRKGADSEYAERITTLAGPILDTGTPLAVTRLRTGTLSRGDFTFQWTTPDRLVFRGSYRAWHASLTPTATPVLGPGNTLPHPVPPSFVRGLDQQRGGDELGVAYLADFSADPAEPATPTDGVAALWRRLEQEPPTARTGVWHLEVPAALSRSRPEMHGSWYSRIVDPGNSLVPLSRVDPIRIGRLVVLDPRVLLLATAQSCEVAVDIVEVQLTPDLAAPDGTGLPVDLLAVSDACFAWWGVRPRWRAADTLDAQGRRDLAQLVPDLAPDTAEETPC